LQQSKEVFVPTSVFSIGRISLFFFANIAASFSTPSLTLPSGDDFRQVGLREIQPSAIVKAYG
jgi:hypothetical protein